MSFIFSGLRATNPCDVQNGEALRSRAVGLIYSIGAIIPTSFIARLIETNHCSNLSLSHIHDLPGYLILPRKHRSASARGTSRQK